MKPFRMFVSLAFLVGCHGATDCSVHGQATRMDDSTNAYAKSAFRLEFGARERELAHDELDLVYEDEVVAVSVERL